MTKAIHLELRYPNLAITDYNVTSPRSQEYNCFAWAAGDQERWWQPTPEDQFYWVEGVPMEETLSAYIQAYQTLGYKPCEDRTIESGSPCISTMREFLSMQRDSCRLGCGLANLVHLRILSIS